MANFHDANKAKIGMEYGGRNFSCISGNINDFRNIDVMRDCDILMNSNMADIACIQLCNYNIYFAKAKKNNDHGEGIGGAGIISGEFDQYYSKC